MAGFVKQIKKEAIPTTAGMLVADETNVGQAGMITAATTEALVSNWWHRVVPFVLESSPAGIFKRDMVGGKTSGVMVFN